MAITQRILAREHQSHKEDSSDKQREEIHNVPKATCWYSEGESPTCNQTETDEPDPDLCETIASYLSGDHWGKTDHKQQHAD